jgi:hypothetical protein
VAEPDAAQKAVTAMNSLAEFIGAHKGCTWEQIGPCVWCKHHNLRLYQGDLPEHKRTTPKCAPEDHDWDPDTGLGFYSQCRACRYIEWFE